MKKLQNIWFFIPLLLSASIASASQERPKGWACQNLTITCSILGPQLEYKGKTSIGCHGIINCTPVHNPINECNQYVPACQGKCNFASDDAGNRVDMNYTCPSLTARKKRS